MQSDYKKSAKYCLLNRDLPFGGKVIVLGRDFWPILPVVKLDLRVQIVSAYAQSSPLWQAPPSHVPSARKDTPVPTWESPESARHGAWLLNRGWEVDM